MTSSKYYWTLHCSIYNNENYGHDAESLPDLDELPSTQTLHTMRKKLGDRKLLTT